MSRPLAALGLCALALIAAIVLRDEGPSALEPIAEPQGSQREVQEADAGEISESKEIEVARQREEASPSRPEQASKLPGEIITRLSGEVFARNEIFGGSRAGITVYCWPGWVDRSPPNVESIKQLRGLQVAQTDEAGRFRFDLTVDDTHWLFAISDGVCSDPKGFRVSTKPYVEVMLEMGRLYGSGYRIESSDSDRGPIDLVARTGIRLDKSSKARAYRAREFPIAFVPGAAMVSSWKNKPDCGAFFVRAENALTQNLTTEIKADLPGHFTILETFTLPTVSLTRRLPTQSLIAETDQVFGEVQIDIVGLPEALTEAQRQAPLSEPLQWTLIQTQTSERIKIPIRSLGDFPLRRLRIPIGEYQLDARGHSNVRIPAESLPTLSVRRDEPAVATVDLSANWVWVFERDPSMEDIRFLTPPRIRVANHSEPAFRTWDEPTQVVLLYPHVDDPISISGSVFQDGPQGPRKDGRLTVYRAGLDDD